MIILWTDALIYLLVLIIVISGWFVRRKPQLQRPLQQISHSKIGMVSLFVLLFFMLIGLLDSIHFKDSHSRTHEIISLLDAWAEPLRTRSEKTYSAPFATHLYSKESILLKNGKKKWSYARLKYGGAHLKKPHKQHVNDVLVKAATGFFKGVACYLLLIGIVGLYSLKGKQRSNHPHPNSILIWLTLLCFLSVSYMIVELSLYYHVLGTDKVGEDVLYQAIKSIRTGLVIGSLTTLIMLPLAIVFGIMAGFFRGWIDDVIQYIYTTLNSIPSVLLIAASILMVQVYMSNHAEDFNSLIVRSDMRLLFLCLILGITSWTGLCRLLRAETLKLREMDYVQAAQTLGVKQSTILSRHILPNVMHIVLISVVLDFSALVLAEAVLSYINIGVDPTTYSWGNMINGARLEMARDPVVWWSLLAAFLFMFSLVLAANLFADTVRNAFDPRRTEQVN